MEENTFELLKNKYLEDMEYFSLQLSALGETFDVISAAFQQQHLGSEAVSCMDTLRHSINDIRNEMNTRIQALLNE